MALVNRATNEITVKLVYYGPGLCGKTTNLEKIYGNPKLDNKGKMISMATETDRTLFFDFMPMELGKIGGRKIRVQLYTVPGQVFYDATRKLVLRGADGVVFVADSQETMKESNLVSLENLYTNLRLNRLDPEKVALVFQCNKRDLSNVSSVEEMTEYLNPREGVAVVEASAINGTGVTKTMRAAVKAILTNLKNNVDLSLPEEEVEEEETEEEVEEAAEPAPEATASEEAAPFGELESQTELPAGGDEPFGLMEESPFDETVPGSSTSEDGDAAPTTGQAGGQPDLQEILARADELVTMLEEALETARGQKSEIERRIGS